MRVPTISFPAILICLPTRMHHADKIDYHVYFQFQRTALILGSHEGHRNIVSLLLEKGAQPNHQDSVSI